MAGSGALLRTGRELVDVVVTAVASTTSLATDAERTWQRLLGGCSGVGPLEQPFVDEYRLPVRIGGPLRESFAEQLTRIEVRRTSYLQQMAIVLGRRLWEGAGAPEVDSRRLMVSIGTAMATAEEIATQYDVWLARGLRAVSPFSVQMYMPNAPAAAVGLERRAKAGIICPLMADASGASAIAEAWRTIVLGEADVAICGGIETWIAPVPIVAFDRMQLMSTRNDDPPGACRPFDADRDGMVYGEGGALLLLETEEHARARGATILGRVLGAAVSSDAHDAIEPDPSGERAGWAIGHALDVAAVDRRDVDAVIAHATGTRAGDLAEARALATAFGGHRPAVYAPKAALGHTWGASGAVDAIIAVQALRDGVLPPTRNLDRLDPDIDLDVVAGAPRPGRYRRAVVDTFGFGGHNVAVVYGAA